MKNFKIYQRISTVLIIILTIFFCKKNKKDDNLPLLAIGLATLTEASNSVTGELDTSFSGDGILITNINQNDQPEAIAIQSDGKILVAGTSNFTLGTSSFTSGDFAVVRYNTDGTLDTTFGTGGIVTTSINNFDRATDIVLQTDGKILVAGYTLSNSGFDFAVVRYNTNGTLDTTFDTDGIVTTNIQNFDMANSIRLQSDGKILVAGVSNLGTPTGDFTVVRYNTNGSLDTTFGSNGIVTTNINNEDFGASLSIQSDGKILLAGTSNVTNSTGDFAVVRYNTNGSLDTTFGSNGIVTTNINNADNGARIALQSDGKILVAGTSNFTLDENTSSFKSGDFAVVRFNTNGSLDTTFGSNGIVTTNITNVDIGTGLAIQSDGKILLLGTTKPDSNYNFTLVRYRTDGTLDNTFDGDGIRTLSFSNISLLLATNIKLDSNGRIFICGSGYTGSNNDFIIVRLR